MPDSPDWTQNINITGSSEAVDVNISGQSDTLDVAVSGQTGNINVNIAAQSAVLNTNISSQTATIDMNIKDATVVVPVSRGQSELSPSPWTVAAAQQVNQTVTPESSAHGLMVIVQPVVNLRGISVFGGTTGATYMDIEPYWEQGVFTCPIAPSVDATYTIQTTANALGSVQVWAVSMDDVVSTGRYSPDAVGGLGINAPVITAPYPMQWHTGILQQTAAASTSHAATSPQLPHPTEITFMAVNFSASAEGLVGAEVWDGAFGTGTLIWFGYLGMAAGLGQSAIVQLHGIVPASGTLAIGASSVNGDVNWSALAVGYDL